MSQPDYQVKRQRQNRAFAGITGTAALAALLCACGPSSSGFSLATGSTAPPAAQQPSAQPETEAGVRAAATQFYGLYSAGQWAQAWQMLTAASQQAAPEATYVAVHEGCQAPGAGVARVIKSVTMAGSTAVVTETLSGVAGGLGSTTDAWLYAGGRWGFSLSQSALAGYSHGSAAADVAALKAAGECAGTQPQPLQTLPTAAAASVPALPTLATLAPLPTAGA